LALTVASLQPWTAANLRTRLRMTTSSASVWHHDAAEYMPLYSKPDDMWLRWKFDKDDAAIGTVADDDEDEVMVVDEAPWWERHGMAEPTSCTQKLKDVAMLDRDSGVWRLR
jgi:hypothetical protein